MNGIAAHLNETLGPMAPVIIIGALSVAFLVFAMSILVKQRPDPMEKLAEQSRAQNKRVAKPLRAGGVRNKKLEKYGAFLEPQNKEQYSQAARKLMNAGYRGRDAVRIFHVLQVLLALAGLGCGITYYQLSFGDQEATTQQMIMYVLGPAGLGYYIPGYWINSRAQKRHQQIEEGFPDALDMMLVCVEAGQSLDQSIMRVSKEIRASYSELAYEFEVVSREIRAGKDKTNVLNDMGDRCGVQDISSFVTVLVQAQVFGTSIADALRVYAGEMRDKRVMKAEEKANKLPTKMTLLTMGLTVPPLLIILVGPSAHGIMQLGNLAN